MKSNKLAERVSSLLFFCLFLLTTASALGQQVGKGSVSLVENRMATAKIILAANPPRYTQIAALELQHYVKKITGVTLPITTDEARDAGDGYRVLVGESELTRALGYTAKSFKSDEFLVETRGTHLALMGRDAAEYGVVTYDENGHWPGYWPDERSPKQQQIWKDHGSLLAVYEFLEKVCGVRWYLLTELGEVVPRRVTLNCANLNIRRKPWCPTRRFNFDMAAPFHFYERWGAAGSPLGSKSIHATGPGHQGWRKLFMYLERSRYGGRPYQNNHSLEAYFHRFAKLHPDWFANSKPIAGGQMCYTNKGLIQQVAKDIIDYFDGKYPGGRYPDAEHAYWITAMGDFHAVVPMDNDKYCTCDRCKPLWQPGESWMFFGGNRSDYVWGFVNEVAKIVGRKHPDKFVAGLAYWQYTIPPSFKLEPNVAVMYCKSRTQYADPRRKAFDRKWLPEWRKRTKHLSTWEYHNFPRGPVFPGIAPRQVAEDMAYLRSLPIDGQFIELDSVNPAIEHLNLYVAMKMLDLDDVDINKLLDEYYRGFYGPAAEPMQAFFAKVEDIVTSEKHWQAVLDKKREHLDAETSWQIMCPPKVLAEFGQLIDKAITAAGRKEPYAERVKLMRLAIYGHMKASAASYHKK